MSKKPLAIPAVAIALFLSGGAYAQQQLVPGADSPQWLKDRRYNEGIGIRTGDLELHPGIAGEFGYDSNYFLRSDQSGVANGPPNAPVIPALEFRLTPSLYLSTLGAQRRGEGEQAGEPPSIAFRAGINATYREFIGVSNDAAASQSQNDISRQRNIGGAADARLDILPEKPWGGAIYGSYSRVVLPNALTADPNQAFTTDNVGAGAEIITQPNSGTLDWRFGYRFQGAFFEDSSASEYSNITNEAYTRGRWKFRPRTALLYDATLGFINYANQDQAHTWGLVNSTPLRARIGLNGLVTDRFAVLALAGWGASFYSTSYVPQQPQYDSIIGQAELKWFLSASPGIASAADLGLAISSIALGYTRDFQNSYLGNYYGIDRGYLKFNFFFAGRALVSLEGGVGSVEYPNMWWNATQERHGAFNDLRTDATLFGEYRFTDTFALNTTLRYTANFSNVSDMPVTPPVAGAATTQFYDMSWTRFEAFLGARWFM